MKKILAYICVIIGIGLVTTSVSSRTLAKIWEWNNQNAMNDKWYGKYKSKWGDLTRMAYLDHVVKFQEPYEYEYPNYHDSTKGSINLCIIGDSYTADLPGYIFKGVATYQHFKNVRPFTYTPDPTKKNVLIIEITERFVRGILRNRYFFDFSKRSDYAATGGDGKKNLSAVVNKNLEYLLFDYNFINRLKFLKAELNYYLFNRASGNISISKDGNFLFFKSTVINHGIYSSYAPISDTEMNYVVNTLNSIYTKYKSLGFMEVCLSVIPNPATILQPEGYNGFIPLLQNDKRLIMPCLDVYNKFKQTSDPASLYRVGDTHWNNNGMQVWLKVVNKRLSVLNRKQV